MPESRLKLTTGNWVSGDRFWGREDEIERFIEKLDNEAHILLVAQRRIGKTSLMREVSRQIQARYICLHVDWQGTHAAEDAIAELVAATREHHSLWEKTRVVFRNILSVLTQNVETLQISELKLQLRSGMTEADWRSKGDRVLEILAASDKPVVVFLDEVPILVNRLLKGTDYKITPDRREQADRFLSWLRANSIQHQGKIRFVVTGSIGLEPVLRQGGLSATINNFSPFDLAPWRAAVAKGCLQALANEYKLVYRDGAEEEVIDRLGVCIPYHVQLFFDGLHRECKQTGRSEISRELVGEIYDRDMLSTRGRAELSHMEERLKLGLGAQLHSLAVDLLAEAAVTGSLSAEAARIIVSGQEFPGDEERSSTEILREVLGVLEHDGYLRRSSSGYQFESNLLKDWWHNSHGFLHVSARERQHQ